MIGYGIDDRHLTSALRQIPGLDLIGADGGSVDPGPAYLGSGRPFVSAELLTRDLGICLDAQAQTGAPIVIGSAGGAGADPHLDFATGCLRAAAAERGRSGLRVARIHAELPAHLVREWIEAGRVSPVAFGPQPQVADVDACERIVGQMGVETIARAMTEEADVVLAGRASDPAVFAGPAAHAGYDVALALHLGKIAECGAHCAIPGSGRGGVYAELGHDSFTLLPTNPEHRCSPVSVAGHMLYENSHPYRLSEPDGVLDLERVTLEQDGDRQVRASGARLEPAERFSVKVEGSAVAGYRSLVLGGMRDPYLVAGVDEVLETARQAVELSLAGEDYRLEFRTFGRGAVLGAAEPDPTAAAELGLVCEAVAPTQELAHAVAQAAESAIITAHYEGGIAYCGNLAVPFSPFVIDAGPTYEWRVFCIAEPPQSERDLFEVEVLEL
jgi:hypothetical protein